MDVIYLNLTNGLEMLPNLDSYKVIRIQSTACEQKRWDFILSDLDNGFLFDLAVGHTCFVIDYSARKEVPRALFQGLEWVKFVLYKVWLYKEYTPIVRSHDCSDYFNKMFHTISKPTLSKLKYFRKFLLTKNIDLIAVGGKTQHDSNYQFYTTLIKEAV